MTAPHGKTGSPYARLVEALQPEGQGSEWGDAILLDESLSSPLTYGDARALRALVEAVERYRAHWVDGVGPMNEMRADMLKELDAVMGRA